MTPRMTGPRPDWEKERVILVDPTIWSEYRKPSCDLRPAYEELLTALRSLKVEHTVLRKEDRPLDIWIRDWGSVENCYFRFTPSYAKGIYTPPATSEARRNLS